MSKLVSVLVSAYNVEEFIREAIDSVLNQTYQHFELIIVNDGSKDATLAIAEEYKKKDERIVILDQKNTGLPMALNNGLKIAKGDLIARFDPDDVMLPERLEEQVKFLEMNPEVSMTSCNAYYINQKGEYFGGILAYPAFKDISDNHKYLNNNEIVICIHCGFMTYRNALLEVGGYRDIKPGSEDTDLFARMLEKGYKLLVLQKPLIKVRLHHASVTVSKAFKAALVTQWVRDSMVRRRKGEQELSLEEYEKYYQTLPWIYRMNLKRIQAGNFHYKNALIYFGNKEYGNFLHSYFLSFFYRPLTMSGRIFNRLFRTILKNKKS